MESTNNSHHITITDRSEILISGVTNVESFDNEEFLLSTTGGYLGIKGKDLSIKNLDLEEGKLAIDGFVNDLSYLDKPNKNEEKIGFFSRLFK